MKYRHGSKAGCEDPATFSTSEVVSNRQSMPVAGMAGSFTRKIPGTTKAGQDVAGDANQVAITHGKSSPGKQTWKGAREGYTSRTVPKFEAAWTSHETSDRAEQSVKGKSSKRTSEAKTVAGRGGRA